MKDSIRNRLDQVQAHFEEIGMLLTLPETVNDQRRYRELTREYAQLEPVMQTWRKWQQATADQSNARALLGEPGSDAELKELAQAELQSAAATAAQLEAELQLLMLPVDPDDQRNIFLEIRAGTGGDEAALFAADLLRMYTRYAESQGWKLELISRNMNDLGGYKEVIARVEGNGAFARLKFESGTHRVQRVPATEAQGRIHTSACTVAILPEHDEIDDVSIDAGELRIDTYRSSGAGGQHVNTTDSAIRITHLPSGLVVECQDERSQHKNKARAMALLRARLLELEQSRQAREVAESRKLQVGSGDRSQRIRTYNFPQGRVTDHRIGLTIYRLDDLLAGNLELVVAPLTQEYHARQLAELDT